MNSANPAAPGGGPNPAGGASATPEGVENPDHSAEISKMQGEIDTQKSEAQKHQAAAEKYRNDLLKTQEKNIQLHTKVMQASAPDTSTPAPSGMLPSVLEDISSVSKRVHTLAQPGGEPAVLKLAFSIASTAIKSAMTAAPLGQSKTPGDNALREMRMGQDRDATTSAQRGVAMASNPFKAVANFAANTLDTNPMIRNVANVGSMGLAHVVRKHLMPKPEDAAANVSAMGDVLTPDLGDAGRANAQPATAGDMTAEAFKQRQQISNSLDAKYQMPTTAALGTVIGGIQEDRAPLPSLTGDGSLTGDNIWNVGAGAIKRVPRFLQNQVLNAGNEVAKVTDYAGKMGDQFDGVDGRGSGFGKVDYSNLGHMGLSAANAYTSINPLGVGKGKALGLLSKIPVAANRSLVQAGRGLQALGAATTMSDAQHNPTELTQAQGHINKAQETLAGLHNSPPPETAPASDHGSMLARIMEWLQQFGGKFGQGGTPAATQASNSGGKQPYAFMEGMTPTTGYDTLPAPTNPYMTSRIA